MSFFFLSFFFPLSFDTSTTNNNNKTISLSLTVAEGLGRGGDRVADAVVDLGHLGALEQLLQARHDRVEAELVLGAVLGPAEVRGQQHLGAVVDEVLERRDRGADAGVVGDLEVLVERDVEVGADLWRERRKRSGEREGEVREGKIQSVESGARRRCRSRSLKRLFFAFFAS